MTTLVRFNPARELNTARRDMDKFLTALFNTSTPTAAPTTNNWGLALDVTEDAEAFNIIATVPGIAADDIEVTIDDGVLKISGEVSASHGEESDEENKIRYHLRERRTGRFARSLRLPKDVNVDEISASHKDGVLTLRLPKTPEIQPKRIAIN